MQILRAAPDNYEEVLSIIHKTVDEIYPNYYPAEVVKFCMETHNKDSIRRDAEKCLIYLISDPGNFVAAGSRNGRYIGRVCVLPEFQGKGYGSFIMKALEDEISRDYSASLPDASLPSCDFYLRSGYKPVGYQRHTVKNNRILCCYVMEKALLTWSFKASRADHRPPTVSLRSLLPPVE